MTALVSVVVPVVDRAHCVADAIASVLGQPGVALECIVVDDGSSDGTVDAVRAVAATDGRVQLLERERGGPSAARNTGIAAARGDLVTFHDSDDLMPSGRLARQVALREDLGVDGVFGRYEVQRVEGVPLPKWLEARPDWHRGWSWTSVLVDRGALDAIGGFDEELDLGEDIDLIVRLREHGRSIATVDEVFVEKRWFGDNLTYQLDVEGSALGTVLRRHMARERGAR